MSKYAILSMAVLPTWSGSAFVVELLVVVDLELKPALSFYIFSPVPLASSHSMIAKHSL